MRCNQNALVLNDVKHSNEQRLIRSALREIILIMLIKWELAGGKKRQIDIRNEIRDLTVQRRSVISIGILIFG